MYRRFLLRNAGGAGTRNSGGHAAAGFFHSTRQAAAPDQQRRLLSSNNTTNVIGAQPPQRDTAGLTHHAIDVVKEHDATGYQAGRFLLRDTPPNRMTRTAYFAARSFWVETGLRLGSTAQVPVNSTPCEHLDFWQHGIDAVFQEENGEEGNLSSSGDITHPTLLLLHHLKQEQHLPWTKCHFDDLIEGRRNDLHTTQYQSLEQLIKHSEKTCGSVAQLVLEGGNLTVQDAPAAHQAAKLAGIAHGLTMQLRQSIPILSTQGRLVIPAELTSKHGVRSPRYLLSALGLGDETCRRALEGAVREVAEAANQHLREARALRPDILAESPQAVPVLLTHTVATQEFLDRLRDHHYQLTDRNLRSVGLLQQAALAARVAAAYYQNKY